MDTAAIQQAGVRATAAARQHLTTATQTAGQWGSRAVTVLTNFAKSSMAFLSTAFRAFAEFATKYGTIALAYIRQAGRSFMDFCSRNTRELTFAGIGAGVALALAFVATRVLGSRAQNQRSQATV